VLFDEFQQFQPCRLWKAGGLHVTDLPPPRDISENGKFRVRVRRRINSGTGTDPRKIHVGSVKSPLIRDDTSNVRREFHRIRGWSRPS
jgi:hypothetical protein